LAGEMAIDFVFFFGYIATESGGFFHEWTS
jgi:hypothetical protein